MPKDPDPALTNRQYISPAQSPSPFDRGGVASNAGNNGGKNNDDPVRKRNFMLNAYFPGKHPSLSQLFSPRVFAATGRNWLAHEDLRIGAAMAFYTIFSLAPILVIATAIAGLAFGRDAVQDRIVGQMQGLLGEDGAHLIQDMIKNAYQADHAGLATLISVIVLLFGASAVFAELSTAFERIWGSSRYYGNAVAAFVLLRVRGLMVVIGIGFLLLTSLVASTLLLAFSDYLKYLYGPLWIVGSILQPLLSILFTTALFMLMTLPLIPVAIPVSLNFISSLLAAILFEGGKIGVGFYLGQSAVASSFGAAGSLAVLLIWIYYVAQVVLLSAEYTAAAYQYGEKNDTSV